MAALGVTLSRGALVAAAFLVASATVLGQQYPTKPVKIIVAFAPGGGNDFIARFMAQKLTTALGQQFIVENKAGAGGSVGFEAGVKSPPDGYTLTLISNSYTVNPAIYSLRFDPLADMTPVIQISQGPLLVVVHPSVQVKNLRELIELAKAKPEQINFALPQGSVTHLAAVLFASMAGIKLHHLPYKGLGPALTDTLGGHTNALFASTATMLHHVRAGRLRALAVTPPPRLPAEPDIPTVAESGVPGYEVVLWHGLIGPKGLPPPIGAPIPRAGTTALKLKDATEQLQNDGVSPAGGPPEQFLATIKNEIAVWRKIVNETGIRVE